MKDAYAQAVEYLSENYTPCDSEGLTNATPISRAWVNTRSEVGGCLFAYCGCGCLTMIRAGNRQSYTKELTEAIFNDQRLPARWSDITVDHLPIFAGWQRRIDAIVGRTPPALDPRLPAPKGDIEIPSIEFEPTTVSA